MPFTKDTKYAAVYNTQTGKILSAEHADESTEYNELPEDFDVLAFDTVQDIDFQQQTVDLDTLRIVDVPPPRVVIVNRAEWENIKFFRDKFANTPVITEQGLLDVDSASMETLQMAEDHFAFLPTVENGKLAWKMADNQIVYLTHAELIAMNTEAKDLRAKQVAIMFYRAEVLRAMDPAPLLEYVALYSNWVEG